MKNSVATAAEMRELLNLGLLKLYATGTKFNTYSGAPSHIRWDTRGYASVAKGDAQLTAVWIQTELHTGNE